MRKFFAELTKEKKADASDESRQSASSATSSRKRGRPRKAVAAEAKSQVAEPTSSADHEPGADETDEDGIDLVTPAEDGSDELDSIVQGICKREAVETLD